MQIEVKTRPLLHRGRRYPVGSFVDVSPQNARVLVAVKLANYAPEQPVAPKAPAKRTYKRRDMKAESSQAESEQTESKAETEQ